MNLPDYIRERHWTTKLVWGVGLGLILLNVVLILVFPPGIAFKVYQVIHGTVTETGVIQDALGVTYESNISCKTIDDCPILDGMKACGKNNLCLGHTGKLVTNPNSFLFKSWTGKEYKLVGGLDVGWRGKVAVEGNEVVAKGGWLFWDGFSQGLSRIFILFLIISTGSGGANLALLVWPFLLLYYFFGVTIFVREYDDVKIVSGFAAVLFFYPALINIFMLLFEDDLSQLGFAITYIIPPGLLILRFITERLKHE